MNASPGPTFAVLGAGLMGAAVARRIRDGGSHTTVWSRTRERTIPLEREGFPVASRPGEAIAAADVIILLLTDFAAAEPFLVESRAHLQGKTVVNLMTGTEGDARRCAEFVAGAGGLPVSGAILSYPSQIGGPTGTVLFSGSEEGWSTCGNILVKLGGRSRWLGPDVGLSAVLDTAATGAFFQTSLAAFIEAAAYAEARGVGVDVLSDLVKELLSGFSASVEQARKAIETRNWETSEATLDTFYSATRLWQKEMQEAGIRAPLLTASLETMRQARDSGYGAGSFYAQFMSSGVKE